MKPTESNNLVSIILPVYNGSKYLAESIKSVLKQSYTHWELIILDDCSQDNSSEVVKQFLTDTRILYSRNEVNLDLQKNLNKGLRMARGEYIARIDQDDQWIDTEKLTKQVDFLNSHKEHVLVGTSGLVMNSSGVRIGKYHMPQTDQQIRHRILAKNCFLHASIMVRKSAIERVKLYSEERAVRFLEDYDLWLRLGTIGKFANLDSASIIVTVHDESMTAKNRLKQARGALALNLLYKKKYPNYFIGHMIGLLRFWFFKIVSGIPFLGKHLYKLQVIYKSI